jgi:hypothetical protein
MLQLLRHQRYSYSSYGPGLPPGTLLYTKLGNAYNTLQEISYVILPNGNDFILATLTDGFEPTEPDIDNLSYLAELLIDMTGLSNGDPIKIIYSTHCLVYIC